jgi:hypothetical protein
MFDLNELEQAAVRFACALRAYQAAMTADMYEYTEDQVSALSKELTAARNELAFRGEK